MKPSLSVSGEKAALRGRLQAIRASSAHPATEAQARNAALLAHPSVLAARRVALYVSDPTEPDTSHLRAEFADRAVPVLLPVLHADDTVTFALDTGTLQIGRRGRQEPAGPEQTLALADVVVVPALAVDRAGVRLGRGGGSYDRALAPLVRPGVPGIRIIALLHPGEFVRHLPSEPHDVTVDAVALPAGVIAIAQT